MVRGPILSSFSVRSTDILSILGWGDIKGIIEKVPYLKELGVDVLWVSPSKL